jgi:NAD(P)-dependent dehydrogenase (short-subunit alcohol dehydrogenase family)
LLLVIVMRQVYGEVRVIARNLPEILAMLGKLYRVCDMTIPEAAPRTISRPHEGRTAVITGAAQGIGRAYAEQLAAGGARLILADVADASGTCELVQRAGGTASTATCDVSDEASVAALAEEVAAAGGADILVHNAGIYPLGPYDQITFAQWRRVMSVNLDSMFLLAQAFLPHMRAQGWGRVIGISTAMFHTGAPMALHYVASKGGLIGLVRSLATEVGADGVTVNAIAPGLIRSDGTSTGLHDDLGLFDMVVHEQAIKRTGMPDDLAGVIAFLVSDAASFITGQTLLVDGGLARA